MEDTLKLAFPKFKLYQIILFIGLGVSPGERPKMISVPSRYVEVLCQPVGLFGRSAARTWFGHIVKWFDYNWMMHRWNTVWLLFQVCPTKFHGYHSHTPRMSVFLEILETICLTSLIFNLVEECSLTCFFFQEVWSHAHPCVVCDDLDICWLRLKHHVRPRCRKLLDLGQVHHQSPWGTRSLMLRWSLLSHRQRIASPCWCRCMWLDLCFAVSWCGRCAESNRISLTKLGLCSCAVGALFCIGLRSAIFTLATKMIGALTLLGIRRGCF